MAIVFGIFFALFHALALPRPLSGLVLVPLIWINVHAPLASKNPIKPAVSLQQPPLDAALPSSSQSPLALAAASACPRQPPGSPSMRPRRRNRS